MWLWTKRRPTRTTTGRTLFPYTKLVRYDDKNEDDKSDDDKRDDDKSDDDKSDDDDENDDDDEDSEDSEDSEESKSGKNKSSDEDEKKPNENKKKRVKIVTECLIKVRWLPYDSFPIPVAIFCSYLENLIQISQDNTNLSYLKHK